MADVVLERCGMKRRTVPPIVRLERHSHLTEAGCWQWTGATNGYYGKLSWRWHLWSAHRLAWTLLRGAIPAGLTVDHVCRNKLCINPEHMELVTLRENMARAGTGLDTCRVCGSSDWKPQKGRGGRMTRACRECERRRQRKWRAERSQT
jgi:hypothetical protein